MKQSLRLGRVAGIPVGVNWSVFLVMVLIADLVAGTILPHAAGGRPSAVYWSIAVPTALLFLASLLAHEVAHAVVARRQNVGVRSITLWMLGGVAQLDDEPPTARTELAIAAAGPVTSLVAGGVLLVGAETARSLGTPALIVAALAWVGGTNAFLAVFNLLPGAPLDGGRVLRAIVWMWSGDRARGDRAATGAGQVVGAVLAGAGAAQLLVLGQTGGLWLMLVGWFLVWAASTEARSRAVRKAAEGVRVRDLMTPGPDCAAAWLPIGEFAAGVAAHSRQSVFPVIGLDGEPRGAVTLQVLSRIPPARTGERVDTVALPLPPGYTAAPDDPATCLLDHAPVGGALLAVVLANGHVTGMVTADDLGRLVQQRTLRDRSASSPADRPAD